MSADLRRILVACRGELAPRLVATYRDLGIESVVAFSEACLLYTSDAADEL